MNIGVLSDTHNFFDPQIPKLFAGVDHILHGGDIGMPMILLELEQIAPVIAVGGNTDDPGFHFPETRVLETNSCKILVHHIVDPHRPSDSLKASIARERPAVVVFGHTHKPFCATIDNTLFFNPGYAGRQRFGLARTVAILRCTGKGIRPEYFEL